MTVEEKRAYMMEKARQKIKAKAEAEAAQALQGLKEVEEKAKAKADAAAREERMSMLERAWAQGEQQAKETKNRPSRRAGAFSRRRPVMSASSVFGVQTHYTRSDPLPPKAPKTL